MFAKEDYVSLETAKMLREKGFDELTSGFYGSKRGLCSGTSLLYNSINKEVNFVDDSFRVVFESCIAAPTLYEAQKWLFTKHNLHVCPTPYMFKDKDKCDWFETDIYLKHETDWSFFAATEEEHSLYQQALDAGIRKALELI